MLVEQVDYAPMPCGSVGITLRCGKRSAHVWVSPIVGVQVVGLNASHRAWRGMGRVFRDFSEALAGYKSAEMVAMIRRAGEIYLDRTAAQKSTALADGGRVVPLANGDAHALWAAVIVELSNGDSYWCQREHGRPLGWEFIRAHDRVSWGATIWDSMPVRRRETLEAIHTILERAGL